MSLKRILEEDNYLFLDTLILFLLVNYSPQIMQIYIGMGLLGFIAYNRARDRGMPLFPYSRGIPHLQAILYGLVALGVFSFIYTFIQTKFALAPTFAEAMSTTLIMGAAPALATSAIVAFFVFGWLIPRIETPFFFRTLLGWFSWKYNLSLFQWTAKNSLLAIGAISIVFMLFHLTAKGISNMPELVACLIFGLMSGIMVVAFKELKPAVYFHIFTNSFALINSL